MRLWFTNSQQNSVLKKPSLSSWRNARLCENRRFVTNSVAPETARSSPYSQEPTGPDPETTGSTPQSPANLPTIHSDTILPSTPWPSKWFLSFWLYHQNPAPGPCTKPCKSFTRWWRPYFSPKDWKPRTRHIQGHDRNVKLVIRVGTARSCLTLTN
jgi:hypothetical protein